MIARATGALLLAAALAPAAPGPVTLAIDPSASQVVFRMKTTWHGVEGRTTKVSGRLTSESGGILADGRIAVEIDAASLDTGNARRDRTMRDSHLETSKHPLITFASTGPPAGGSGGAPLRIPGDLTIHGVTRAVTLPVSAKQEGDAWVVDGELAVRLSEYGIPDPSIFLNNVHDEVRVVFKVKLVPAGPPR